VFGGALARQGDGDRRRVDPDDLHAAPRPFDRMEPGAAADVEDTARPGGPGEDGVDLFGGLAARVEGALEDADGRAIVEERIDGHPESIVCRAGRGINP